MLLEKLSQIGPPLMIRSTCTKCSSHGPKYNVAAYFRAVYVMCVLNVRAIPAAMYCPSENFYEKGSLIACTRLEKV